MAAMEVTDFSPVLTAEMRKSGELPFPDRPVVLVVDDDHNILDAFELFLKKEKLNMLAASSVDEALEKIKDTKVDIMIADFMMETKSSVELYSLVRKKNPSIPIIVITGYPELVSEQDIKMFGANHLLTKPLELGTLRSFLENCCDI